MPGGLEKYQESFVVWVIWAYAWGLIVEARGIIAIALFVKIACKIRYLFAVLAKFTHQSLSLLGKLSDQFITWAASFRLLGVSRRLIACWELTSMPMVLQRTSWTSYEVLWLLQVIHTKICCVGSCTEYPCLVKPLKLLQIGQMSWRSAFLNAVRSKKFIKFF